MKIYILYTHTNTTQNTAVFILQGVSVKLKSLELIKVIYNYYYIIYLVYIGDGKYALQPHCINILRHIVLGISIILKTFTFYPVSGIQSVIAKLRICM